MNVFLVENQVIAKLFKILNSIQMKAHHFVLMLFFASLFSYSQTTLTEYNYLTKGYKMDLDTGRDIKDGYVLKLMNSADVIVNLGGEKIARKSKLYRFIKEDEDRTVAFLLINDRLDTEFEEYICIPSLKSDVKVRMKFQEDIFNGCSNDNDTDKGAKCSYYYNSLILLSYTI